MRNRILDVGFSLAVATIAAISLSGCATAAKPEAMVAKTQPADRAFPHFFSHAMCVRTVSGGEKTNPLWVSKVDNDGFRSALGTSLDAAGLTAPASGCAYPIDINLLGLSQPSFGFDMTVTSHVNYKVYDFKIPAACSGNHRRSLHSDRLGRLCRRRTDEAGE